ncbi:histidine kinase [Sphingomonas ginsenosidivorax]|uniref:histidine kinase n=1 Tax=Sphingomonas ginsenosidivorax TaxID=862135 RepID=A0A5C6UI98_9SPHN|nr:sensor histidine kinase [Sphingomonas ginsenosidivorax]TXC71946.1 histidine kinase [Sphingomonas ginsenosidivorax]
MRQTRIKLVANTRPIGRVLLACMVLGFASLIAAGIAAAWLTGRNQEHVRWVNHTYEVELAIAQASIAIEQGETPRRGYLITRAPIYLDTYLANRAKQPATLARVSTLTADNPRQRASYARLVALVADLQRQRDLTVSLVREGRGREAIALFFAETDAKRMMTIRRLAAHMAQEERRLLKIRDADQVRSVRAFYIVLGIAGLILLVVAILSVTTVMRYTRDLTRSRDSLNTLNETLEEQVAERTADLSLANDEIQRFAYIVSHDLRSPLVNVMGFTAELAATVAPLEELLERAEATAPEIVTEDARLAVREDLPEAVGFIRTSTQKMDRLINAILKLSREGRRVIAPERLDVAEIVANICGSMQHIIDDRGATVSVEGTIPGLVSDRLAIEQILSNLIENATKYLKPGRPGVITVSGHEERGRVVLSVADNGRGIDTRDHARVFDLFRRSGAQDQPGEGIGLAHVRALAYRLGGTIDLASELGEGATFRLNLPKTLTVQDPKA